MAPRRAPWPGRRRAARGSSGSPAGRPERDLLRVCRGDKRRRRKRQGGEEQGRRAAAAPRSSDALHAILLPLGGRQDGGGLAPNAARRTLRLIPPPQRCVIVPRRSSPEGPDRDRRGFGKGGRRRDGPSRRGPARRARKGPPGGASPPPDVARLGLREAKTLRTKKSGRVGPRNRRAGRSRSATQHYERCLLSAPLPPHGARRQEERQSPGERAPRERSACTAERAEASGAGRVTSPLRGGRSLRSVSDSKLREGGWA